VRWFSALYDRVLEWSRHPRAPMYLAGLSFAESSFFPIPPDVMLAPMCLAQLSRAWYFAALTTLASVLGGLAGYLIGYFAFDWVAPLIESAGYLPAYEKSRAWFEQWGFWAIFLAGFAPIPYKIFTITGGMMAMFLPSFLLASLIGRGARFYLVAGLVFWGGEAMESTLRRYVDRIGWATVVLVLLALAWLA
jgi:membrane protein YqaA with SNARE-associated domain